MIVFLIILAALVGVGLPLYLLHRADERRVRKSSGASLSEEPPVNHSSSSLPTPPSAPPSQGEESDDVCCGLHITCEKDSLLADVSETIDYFDDEDLDRFAGRSADDYNQEEIEEFRDVLLTLIPTDIAPWARSIQLRGITLPAEVREELLMIVAEARQSANT